ncbi:MULTISPECIES: amidohydrolase [Burkholderia]|uniref:Putative TIM-barrel fold metal-dependent hydrolase n=1 Tax=Burkholderia pyrrocinia TaxID=60550 RepID=A0A318J2C8_BURPY|nr:MULTISPECIES: amidohydrolase family protein [Burkholderia]PXX38068.1 putative TIM-barrel fold metal-dependent hydrolase [Burkholderia pyrrocinia]SFW52261.1 Predicted metal-dependent hydrolase, TIM-barrel fold [Burkholderia sp. NFACC33-1]SFX61034.1 Predicted metal-dependent hydrolase, TIM-barrel fold [Burkholderia sp. NFPP32]
MRDGSPPDGSPPDGMPDALVDAHHHLWRLDAGAHYPWLQTHYDPARFMFGDYAALCRDFGVDDFRHAAQRAPIVASVHVEAERARDEALAETRWLHEVAAAHGLPSAVVAWVDLLAGDADERLAEQAAWPRVRGIRFKPRTASSPDTPVDGPGTLHDPRWPAALERVAAHGLCWDLRVSFWHLDDAAALLADAPAVDVVLEHAGLPWDRSDAGLARWRRGMEALAASPRVVVKISELGLRDAAWNDADNARIIRDTIAIFGWERCLFASNFPVAGLRVSYPALLRTFARAMANLDDAARRAIWHDNAVRVYRIALDEPFRPARG